MPTEWQGMLYSREYSKAQKVAVSLVCSRRERLGWLKHGVEAERMAGRCV